MRRAIFQAIFVTILWSTSWVLIKFGLGAIPALTFAGLRYFIAFVCLLPFTFQAARLAKVRQLTRAQWFELIGLGVLMYTAAQGAQFLGLFYLPAIAASLLLNFTAPLTTVLGLIFLKERPTLLQWGGVALNLIGALVYFYPITFSGTEWIGVGIVSVGVVATSVASILGRRVNSARYLDALGITSVSMGIGASLLLASGLVFQGLPPIALKDWGIILWLAVVNTALAFTLWNHTLKTLTAMQSSLINNTMLVQISLLAWVFLSETITPKGLIGLALAVVGAVLVQIRR